MLETFVLSSIMDMSKPIIIYEQMHLNLIRNIFRSPSLKWLVTLLDNVLNHYKIYCSTYIFRVSGPHKKALCSFVYKQAFTKLQGDRINRELKCLLYIANKIVH